MKNATKPYLKLESLITQLALSCALSLSVKDTAINMKEMKWVKSIRPYCNNLRKKP